MKCIVATLILAGVLSGCSSVKELIVTKPEIVERPAINIELPRPVQSYPLEFIIITKDNAETKFKELEASGSDVVVFALTDDGYKALSLSVAELRRYIQQQNAVIKAYKDYYEPATTKK